MKKCKVYIKGVECYRCDTVNDKLIATDIEVDCDYYYNTSILIECRCPCGATFLIEEKDIDFGE
jgi:hypothetical protein